MVLDECSSFLWPLACILSPLLYEMLLKIIQVVGISVEICILKAGGEKMARPSYPCVIASSMTGFLETVFG